MVHELTYSISTLKKPELKISTKVRKGLAAVCNLLELTEHLGHTKDGHNNWYRQEASTVELTHIVQLLLAKDRSGESFKNKK